MKKLARTMRNEGILVYKTPEIELSLSPSAVFKEENRAPLHDSQTNNEIDTDSLSAEDVLLWSAGAASNEVI